MAKDVDKTAQREAHRVDTSFPVEFRRLNENELADIEEEINSHRTNDRLGLPSPHSDLPSDLEDLKDYQEMSPQILNMWLSIDQKLDALMKLSRQKALRVPNAREGIIKDISSKGIKIKIYDKLKHGEFILLRISPPTFPSFTLDAVGKVLKLDSSEGDQKIYNVEFTALNSDDREMLITYVFKRQREILRGRLEEETEKQS
jgi:hypothetical protein